MTLYEHCNNAYIQLIAFDPQLLITAMKANISAVKIHEIAILYLHR